MSNSPHELFPGRLVRLSSFQDRVSPDLRLGFKAQKGRQWVALLLGTEPAGDCPETDLLDFDVALRDLGWERAKESEVIR